MYKKGLSYTLVFGTLDVEEPHQTLSASDYDIILHHEYCPNTFKNDIAIFQLKTILWFGPKLYKIDIIDRDYRPKEGDYVKMLGYTKTEDRKKIFKSNLQYVDSKVEDFSVCKEMYINHKRKRSLEDGRQFCVSLRNKTRHNTNKGNSVNFRPFDFLKSVRP